MESVSREEGGGAGGQDEAVHPGVHPGKLYGFSEQRSAQISKQRLMIGTPRLAGIARCGSPFAGPDAVHEDDLDARKAFAIGEAVHRRRQGRLNALPVY